MFEILWKILGGAVAIWILIWVVYHPAEVHQIANNVGSFFSSAK